MNKLSVFFCSVGTAIFTVSCGSGGSNPPDPYANINPYPYPKPLTYIPMPYGFESALPTFVMPNSKNLKIAFGHNDNPKVLNLIAMVGLTFPLLGKTGACSATPVAGDNNSTWLVGAAHCFLNFKQRPDRVSTTDLLTINNIKIYNGTGPIITISPAIAESAIIFIPQDYCLNATFTLGNECPNFSPSQEEPNGQGNDIALIKINARFGDFTKYPQLAPETALPTAYTMAPVLSSGYGINNYNYNYGYLFYVRNYYYQKQDALGYHYLLHSYFNQQTMSYSTLVCSGDSGGGDLFWDGSNWILISEHTVGPDGACGNYFQNLPNQATNVAYYYTWLRSIISDANPSANCNNGNIANCVTNDS